MNERLPHVTGDVINTHRHVRTISYNNPSSFPIPFYRNAGLGSLVIETMKAIDDFESFANFMDNAAASSDDDDDVSGCSGEKKDDTRCCPQDSKDSEDGSHECRGNVSNCRRK